MNRRLLSIWLPWFVSDRRFNGRDEAEETPHAVVAAAGNRITVRTANIPARTLGLATGMSLADARALCPELITEPDAPAEDEAALAKLITACERFSPMVAPQGIDAAGSAGIWIDATGCPHLFGGENAYLDRIAEAFDKKGYAVRLGLADTKGAAWAVSRFGSAPIVRLRPGELGDALNPLPIAALGLAREAVGDLSKLGLNRIADIAARPRSPLASRFGADLLMRLDRAAGRLPDPLALVKTEAPPMRQTTFAEPIARTEDVEAALATLLEDLCDDLAAAHQGIRNLTAQLFRVDGETAEIRIGTHRPSRDAVHLLKMLAQKLDGLDAGFGFELIRVTATVVERAAPAQSGLDQDDQAATDLPALLDRLGNRLGPAAVSGLRVCESHQPERVAKRTRALAPISAAPWPTGRPVRLLAKPTPARPEAGGVLRFSWRGHPHTLVRVHGPERIEPEWWRQEDGRRDYYRAEDADGHRFWLFRTKDARWFVHGQFA